jgi:hypothetical protein
MYIKAQMFTRLANKKEFIPLKKASLNLHDARIAFRPLGTGRLTILD